MVKPILLYYYMVQKYGVLVKIFNVLKKYNLDFAHEIWKYNTEYLLLILHQYKHTSNMKT